MELIEATLKCRYAILKIASRCNLNCTYCYVYNKGDKSYLLQPKKMSTEIIDAFINKAKEHCVLHKSKAFTFIFHGGEPLLAGKEFFEYFVEKVGVNFRDIDTEARFTIQTNGVLLSEEWCELFNKLRIRIGISIDGPKAYNDINRIDHSNKGSFDNIIKGINVVKNYGGIPLGILSVVNVEIPPEEMYDFLKELDVTWMNFLLPDGNYDNPPEGLGLDYSETIYADWLISLFDMWFEDNSNRLDIGMFRSLIYLVLGVEVAADEFGTRTTDALVIETNGDIESLDVLKICGDGFTKGDANVKNTSFDEALNTPLARSYHLSHKILSKKCQDCVVKDICGGGNLPHRFSSENKFDNPSVYCANLYKLIIHIQNKIISKLPESLVKESGIKELEYNKIE
ncbi:radical SAM protein [Tenacibaculum caenipelagi]|uniref:Radical SAM core domain-containing protein n=1 Tax=Tenacibaculum caenipelagi TaxID=1325435 RepID=A0A4R6TCF9_9FLAO|nr:radical SAM protein [Tenacibaculum caenipelagi]TDQ25454.1 uncharacterized protein DFQ07_1876 [Tenacibaculum caenipelagi]